MMKKGSRFREEYIQGLKDVLDRIPLGPVEEIVQAIELAQTERRQIFVIGNGGSAATASHMMNDLCKGTLGHKRGCSVAAVARHRAYRQCLLDDGLGKTIRITITSSANR